MTGHAVVIGEALIDLLESADEWLYRPAVGGAPLNVAVGIARLGGRSEFVGSLGDDPLGARIRAFLAAAGVGTGGTVNAAGVPTTLAVTTFSGAEPQFRFYGSPPSYGLLTEADLDPALVAGAGVLYCGSIGLLCPPVLATARRAWAMRGPVRAFDPNIRPSIGFDRAVVAEFAATADLVKLSAADALALYGEGPQQTAARLAALGAGTVVVTQGAAGALVVHDGASVLVPAPAVEAIDATGAGDATMAGLLFGILGRGLPADLAGWAELTRFAVAVAGFVVESPGGATSMPTLDQLRARFGEQVA